MDQYVARVIRPFWMNILRSVLSSTFVCLVEPHVLNLFRHPLLPPLIFSEINPKIRLSSIETCVFPGSGTGVRVKEPGRKSPVFREGSGGKRGREVDRREREKMVSPGGLSSAAGPMPEGAIISPL